jgi:Na+/proline symporter
LFLIFLLVGAMLWVFSQHAPEILANGQHKIDLASLIPEVRPGSGIKKNDFIYPVFMLTGVPHILKGLLIVAILSAAMSSVSSALTSLASVSTMDFVKKMLPQKSELFFLRFSKVSTVFWAAALIFVAYLSREVTFVLDIAFKLRGLTSGALLGGLFLAVFWKRGNAVSVIIGMIVSLLVMTYISPIVQNLWVDAPEKSILLRDVAEFLQAHAKNLKLPVTIGFAWYTLIGAVVTLAVAFAVRPFTKGKSPEKIGATETVSTAAK